MASAASRDSFQSAQTPERTDWNAPGRGKRKHSSRDGRSTKAKAPGPASSRHCLVEKPRPEPSWLGSSGTTISTVLGAPRGTEYAQAYQELFTQPAAYRTQKNGEDSETEWERPTPLPPDQDLEQSNKGPMAGRPYRKPVQPVACDFCSRLCLRTLAQARERGIRSTGKDGEAGNALALPMQPDAARQVKTRSKPVIEFSDTAKVVDCLAHLLLFLVDTNWIGEYRDAERVHRSIADRRAGQAERDGRGKRGAGIPVAPCPDSAGGGRGWSELDG